MKCFVHPDADARALCKHCGKALCADCAQEAEGGVSCGGACAEHVALGHALLVRSKAVVGASTAGLRGTCHFLVISGFVMGGYGVATDLDFATLMGVLFVVMGIAGYWITRAAKH